MILARRYPKVWRRLARLSGWLLVPILAGCQATLFSALNATSGSDGVVARADIVFDADHGLALDVYAPPAAQDAPVVVFFYGGSWKSGKRHWYRWLGEAFARRGIVVVIPDYRHYPPARLSDFMADAARAVAWTRAHAAQSGGDPRRLFVMGHSAGAHLGALLATDARWLEPLGMRPRDLAGFIGLAGPYDFLPLTDPDFIDMFGHDAASQRRSQPVAFVDGDEPPMLLLQGTDDHTVDPRNTQSLAGRLRETGEPVSVRMIPDTGHTGLLLSLARGPRGASVTMQAIVEFVGASQAP